MKNIFIIGGTMGVGKTTICQIMKHRLNSCVFLDGDWCWDMDPFKVNEETKNMVMENICFMLNNFIKCSVYKNIVFCWVMHEQNIIDTIISEIDTTYCNIYTVSLLCNEYELEKRLTKDVYAGIRQSDIIKKSTERLSLYKILDTHKLDISELSPEQAADLIIDIGCSGIL